MNKTRRRKRKVRRRTEDFARMLDWIAAMEAVGSAEQDQWVKEYAEAHDGPDDDDIPF